MGRAGIGRPTIGMPGGTCDRSWAQFSPGYGERRGIYERIVHQGGKEAPAKLAHAAFMTDQKRGGVDANSQTRHPIILQRWSKPRSGGRAGHARTHDSGRSPVILLGAPSPPEAGLSRRRWRSARASGPGGAIRPSAGSGLAVVHCRIRRLSNADDVVACARHLELATAAEAGQMAVGPGRRSPKRLSPKSTAVPSSRRFESSGRRGGRSSRPAILR